MSAFRHAVALEGRLFDTLSHADASTEIAEKKLDRAKMQQLQQHEELLQALDNWVRLPDRKLVTPLLELCTVVQKLYDLPAEMLIYRGFDPKSDYQNTMGLSEKGFFHNTVHPYYVGETHQYLLKDAPLSFTLDEGIARAFGKTVVRTRVFPRKERALVMTDELCALVCKRRNIALQTQKEVLLLPEFRIDFVIHEKRP